MDKKITELPLANLPLVGNEPIALVQSGETRQANSIELSNNFTTILNLTYTSLGIQVNSSETVKKQAISDYLEGYTKQSNETLIVKLFAQTYNFELTADWSSQGVSDAASLQTFLDGRSNGTNTVSDFYINGNELKCNLVTTATVLDLSGITITEIFNLNSLIGLTSLDFSLNSLDTALYTSFEPWANFQTSFTSTCSLDFSSNLNTITGTNLEAILLTKNTTIIA